MNIAARLPCPIHLHATLERCSSRLTTSSVSRSPDPCARRSFRPVGRAIIVEVNSSAFQRREAARQTSAAGFHSPVRLDEGPPHDRTNAFVGSAAGGQGQRHHDALNISSNPPDHQSIAEPAAKSLVMTASP